jgi:predicted 3-demethylubiquinone-9 3-methyltransferase (glyoxalase superfamily)
MAIQKITPFLWFDQQAEEAANFYTSVFPNSRIVKVLRYGEAGPGPARSQRVMKAMMTMKKLDTRRLQEAYDNG